MREVAPMDQELPDSGLLRIDLRGKDSAIWQRLRERLLQAIDGALDTIADPTKQGDCTSSHLPSKTFLR